TAQCDQWCGGEAKLVRAQQSSDDHIRSGTQLAIALKHHTRAQIVGHQHLMSLGDAQLPGETSVLDASPAGGASATIVTRNGDVFRLAFSHTGSDNAHAHLGHQLDRDTSGWVGTFEIVNQFGQILNRVDIVMWWWRD